MSPKDWKREIESRAAEHAPRVPAWKDEMRRSSGMSEEGLRRLVRGMADFERTEGPEVAVPQIRVRAWHRPCECAVLRERLHDEHMKRLASTYAAILASIAAVGLAVTR